MRRMTRLQTPEERAQRARRSIRRAIWYFIVLIILLILIARPQLITRYLP